METEIAIFVVHLPVKPLTRIQKFCDAVPA